MTVLLFDQDSLIRIQQKTNQLLRVGLRDLSFGLLCLWPRFGIQNISSSCTRFAITKEKSLNIDMTKIMMLGTQKSKMVIRIIIGCTIKQFAVGTNSVVDLWPFDCAMFTFLPYCWYSVILAWWSLVPLRQSVLSVIHRFESCIHHFVAKCLL